MKEETQAMPSKTQKIDPFFEFILGLCGGRGWVLALLYVLLYVISMMLFKLFGGLQFYIEGKDQGILEDTSNIINHFILVPVGILMVHRFIRSIHSILDCPYESSFLKGPVNPERLFGLFSGQITICISVFMGLIITLFSDSEVAPAWQRGEYRIIGDWSGFALVFKAFTTINYTIIVGLTLRGLAFMWNILLLKPEDVFFQPLNDDEMGGVSSLSVAVMDLSSFVTLIALFLLNQAYLSTGAMDSLHFQILFGAYLVVYILSLSLPLLHLKSLSSEWRKRQNKNLREQYSSVFPTEDITDLANHLTQNKESIETILETQSVIKRVPNWPLALSPFVAYLALNILAPATVGIATNRVQELIKGIIGLTG